MNQFYLTTLEVAPDPVNRELQLFTYGWGSKRIQKPETELSDVEMSISLREIKLRLQDPRQCELALGRHIKTDEMCVIGDKQHETSVMVINFY